MAETKSHDKVSGPAVVNDTRITTQLWEFGQGDTAALRDGDKINASGIKIKGYVESSAVNVGAAGVRIAVVRPKGTATTANLPSGGAISYLDYIDPTKFQVIKDKVFTPMTLTGGPDKHRYHFEWWLPFKRTLTFQAGTTDLVGNNYYIYQISSAAANGPSVYWNAREYFKDI